MIRTSIRNNLGSAFMLFWMLYFLSLSSLVPFLVIFLHERGVPMGAAAMPWILILTQLLGLLLPLGIWLAVTRDKLVNHLPNMRLGKSNLIYIIFISIFIQPTMMIVSGLSSLLAPNLVSEVMGGMAEIPLWLMILAIGVAPAICEELVFRGYIQSQYKHHTLKKAALINGLFFGIMHMNIQQFFYAFIMGIIFFMMVHYTRSIRAGILSHFVLNASQATLAHFAFQVVAMTEEMNMPVEPADLTIPFGEGEIVLNEQMTLIMGMMFIGFIAMLTLPCVVILFRAFISHNRSRNMEYDMKQALGGTTEPTPEIAPETTPDAIPEEPQEVVPEIPQKPASRLPFDPFLVAVVALFLLVVIIPRFI